MGTKVTDLTELATTPANDDVLHIIDVSDTTGGSAGTSKKIQVSNLPSGGGSGTVTSVGVTGGTGITSSGGPITTSGSITVGITAGGVDTASIADDAVTNAKIGSSAVGTTEIASGAVTQAKIAVSAVATATIAGSAVTTAKIADDAVTNAKLALDSVGTTEVADEAITTDKLADNAVTGDKLNAALADLNNVSSATPSNEQVLTYNATSSVWEPRTSSGGGGGGTNNLMKTFAFFDNNIRNVYLPWSNESEVTSLQRYNKFVVPAALEIKSISILWSGSKTGGTGGSLQIGTVSGSSFSVTETVSFSSITLGVTTYTFSSSSFSAGTVVAIKLNNGFTSSYGNTTGTILMEI